MLHCKRLLNQWEETVFLWWVPQAPSWRTFHVKTRLCHTFSGGRGCRAQGRGLGWDSSFQNPPFRVLPARLHLLKSAFPSPGCPRGPSLQMHTGTGQWGFIFHEQVPRCPPQGAFPDGAPPPAWLPKPFPVCWFSSFLLCRRRCRRRTRDCSSQIKTLSLAPARRRTARAAVQRV